MTNPLMYNYAQQTNLSPPQPRSRVLVPHWYEVMRVVRHEHPGKEVVAPAGERSTNTGHFLGNSTTDQAQSSVIRHSWTFCSIIGTQWVLNDPGPERGGVMKNLTFVVWKGNCETILWNPAVHFLCQKLPKGWLRQRKTICLWTVKRTKVGGRCLKHSKPNSATRDL